MALTEKKIDGNTPIKNFPEKYNALIDELTDIIAQKDAEISRLTAALTSLRSEFIGQFNTLRSEYINMFDQLENKYVKKEN